MIAATVAFVLALAADQNAVSAARDLYASAAYEDALVVLDRATAGSPDETRAIAQYRALCLLALGRTADAERAMEALVSSDPMFRPTAADASPRVRAAFAEVRRRMLPAIVQQRYVAAKEAFDRKAFADAAAAFSHVLEVMDDVDAPGAMAQPPLSDLRTLAAGFRDLAASAVPPPLPAAPLTVPSPAPAAPAPVQSRIYSGADPGIVPPQTIKQELPPFPGEVMMGKQGLLEVVIDERGTVESATIRQSVGKAYDTIALAATRAWRYQPARVDGVPVKFRKLISVSVKPRSN